MRLPSRLIRAKIRRVAGLVALGAACSRPPLESSTSTGGEPAAARETIQLPVLIDRVVDDDLIVHLNTTGRVESDAVVPLKAEVAGTVLKLLARPGSTIRAGQPLVQFDPYPFDLAVREAQARTDEAEQRFLESFVPDSLITGHGPQPTQRRALMNRAGLVVARLQLERVRYEQARAIVSSPISGMVQSVSVATGEKVMSGQSVATVVDTKRLTVDVQVLEHDLPLIRVGGDARITTAGASANTVRGRIEAILPLVDSVARAGRVVVRIANAERLRPGMYVDVQLEATRLRNRRLVPTRAVIERDGRPLVFVVRDGRAQWTYIVPGRNNGTHTEVLPDSSTGEIPVQPGDAVIVNGHLTLTHDVPVRVVRDTTTRRPPPA